MQGSCTKGTIAGSTTAVVSRALCFEVAPLGTLRRSRRSATSGESTLVLTEVRVESPSDKSGEGKQVLGPVTVNFPAVPVES